MSKSKDALAKALDDANRVVDEWHFLLAEAKEKSVRLEALRAELEEINASMKRDLGDARFPDYGDPYMNAAAKLRALVHDIFIKWMDDNLPTIHR